MKTFPQRVFLIFACLSIVAAIALAMKPRPVQVDFATVARGPLVVTITDDGQTRIRDRYVVSAPLSGRLVRIEFDPGDDVDAQETLLTSIEPTDPALLDPRAIAQAEARVRAAEARANLAKPRLESAKVALSLAETEMGRVLRLSERSSGAQQDLDQKKAVFRRAGYDLEAARSELRIAEFELDVARAALMRTDDSRGDNPNPRSFPVRSPVSGKVLRVFQESSAVVPAGARILEIGDPSDLEVVVDMLSTAAVRIRAGNRVSLHQWGGGHSLPGVVRLVEPSAFTKVSALGIEEQRVNVLIDFADDVTQRPPLGDGFRVEASVVEWESDDVLVVPAGALFRNGDSWAVFVVRSRRAILTRVQLGHRNDDAAEVRDGLQAGDEVILYPGDRVSEGSTLAPRSEDGA